MAPLFDQDSGPDAESPPAQQVGPAFAGPGETDQSAGSSEDRAGFPNGADAVEQGLSGQDGGGEPDSSNENATTETSVDQTGADDRAGDGDANPPAVSGAGPRDTTAGMAATDVTPGPDGTDPHTPPASSLPPPPMAEPAPARAWAPAAPPASPGRAEAEPATPATTSPTPPAAEQTKIVSAAPSSAGPAPAQVEPARRAPAGTADRLASRIRLLASWPSPVRASPDQRGYSLIMLFLLAVTVGIVGAGILVGLVFLIVGALGHGSGG